MTLLVFETNHMPTRTKTKWKTDSRGRYPRELGYKRNKAGKLVPHKFYLGTDLVEAKRRNVRLEELWEVIESDHEKFSWTLEWNSLTLMTGREIAKGNYQIVVPRKRNQPDSYAGFINRLQNSFGMLTFVPEPDEEDTYRLGAEMARTKWMKGMKGRLREFRVNEERRMIKSGATTANEVCLAEDTLHEAFDDYIDHIKNDAVLPGKDTLSDYGHARIQNVARLKEKHQNVALAMIGTFDAVQSLIDVWRGRPMVKNSDPPRPITKKTAQHHIAELMRFYRWLNRSSLYEWRKPNDFDELATNVKESPQEKSQNGHTQVSTYTLDELKLLNEYATPLERLLLMLGLNCGFGAAEQGRIFLSHLYLRQAHPNADLLAPLQGYESAAGDSHILMTRPKTGVYGEWLLWQQTVEAIQWGRDRREKVGGASADAPLLVTDRGTPFLKQTTGGNRGQNFNRRWADLTTRIRNDYPQFPKLSFGKLRKTAGNMVRQIADGEVAGVFLCHGRPVKTDDLIDLYTDRPFAKVFDALKQLEEKLKPVFDNAPDDLTSQPKQQYTGLKKSKRIFQLREEGKTVRQIAETVGLSKSTIHRHLANQRHSQ
jgi:hypothetical protein